ncbi:MAG: LuxR C-terminal-related transcriptional regulator [Pseudomonadota bacterium]
MDDCQGWQPMTFDYGGNSAASASEDLTGSRCGHLRNEQMGKEDLIFFADNDPQTSSQHCVTLDRAGYTVKRCPLNILANTLNGTLQGIVVLNLGSNVKAGLETQQQLIADGRAWPVIFITDCEQIPEAVKAMKAGATDFHVTSVSPGKLLHSVQEAMLQLDAEKDLQLRRTGIEQHYINLTRREKEIMEYVTNGVTNQDTAQQLGLSMRTIEVHRSRIMEKMGARCLADLTRMVDLCRLCSSNH